MAFALINGENIDSWWWFLVCIRIGVTQMSGLWVILYRHLSIMTIINDVHFGWFEPYAYHRVCMRHLASNFMTWFKNKILKKSQMLILFYQCLMFEFLSWRLQFLYLKLKVWGKGLTILNDLLNIWLTHCFEGKV